MTLHVLLFLILVVHACGIGYYPPCVASLCDCNTCRCGMGNTSDPKDILRRAFRNKRLFFFGDSTLRNMATVLERQLSNVTYHGSHAFSNVSSCALNCDINTPRNRLDYGVPEMSWVLSKSSQWHSYASLHKEEELFTPGWNNVYAYVPSTNTSVSIIFCTTPAVLAENVEKMWAGYFGVLPDICIMHVGIWSVGGPDAVVRLNQRLADAHMNGRFRVPVFSLTTTSKEIVDILHNVDSKFVSLQLPVKPVVIFRDLFWLGNVGDRYTQARVVRKFNQDLVMRFRKKSFTYARWFSGSGLTSLPCCRYYRQGYHPGTECNLFLNVVLAVKIVSIPT
jgi:hypothetical protein